MGTQLEGRIAKLEHPGGASVGVVGIFNPETGELVRPLPAGAVFVVLLPDNGRDVSERQG